MSSKLVTKPLAIALGAAFATSLTGASIANAAGNPFGMTELSSGYMVADSNEGKCGEAKTRAEGKCGEGKTKAEGKCGEAKTKAEGKCGEGKCGEGMKEKSEKAKEGKCGEAKCGAAK
ncbi:MAG: hypothetical protein J5I92_05565 [Thiogranum sp.]|nr:hypothetical protein [Thiogranum sp.]